MFNGTIMHTLTSRRRAQCKDGTICGGERMSGLSVFLVENPDGNEKFKQVREHNNTPIQAAKSSRENDRAHLEEKKIRRT